MSFVEDHGLNSHNPDDVALCGAGHTLVDEAEIGFIRIESIAELQHVFRHVFPNNDGPSIREAVGLLGPDTSLLLAVTPAFPGIGAHELLAKTEGTDIKIDLELQRTSGERGEGLFKHAAILIAMSSSVQNVDLNIIAPDQLDRKSYGLGSQLPAFPEGYRLAPRARPVNADVLDFAARAAARRQNG